MTTLPVASRWFHVTPLADGVTLLTEPHVDWLLRSNLFHVRGRDADLLVDAGLGVAPLRPALGHLVDDGRPVLAVATHTHSDHVGGLHEFEERLVHPSEAAALVDGVRFASLLAEDFPPDWQDGSAFDGAPLPEILIDAVPAAGFDPRAFRILPAPPTRLVDEGDEISLGDRTFAVLHTPGHSPGGISLFEQATGILFSGDAIYDDVLLDEIGGADIHAYVATMRRLRALDGVRVVHAGHEASFGPERLVELCDDYIARRG